MTKGDAEALRKLIRQMREERGLSPAELGRKAGLPEGRMAGIEAGQRVIRFSDIVAISDALDTTPSALVRRLGR